MPATRRAAADPAVAAPPRPDVDPALADRLQRLDRLERWLDRQFHVPLIRMPVGMDGLMGLVPIIGDTATAAISVYIIMEAHRAGADGRTKMRMLGNVGLDYLIGLVPVLGWIGDFFHKANTKNVRLLKAHLMDKGATGGGR